MTYLLHNQTRCLLLGALLALLAPCVYAQTYQPPITVSDANYAAVTKNGVLSGNWQSTDPKVPAVQIQTQKPVIVTRCHLRGPGDLIDADAGGAVLTVRDCAGVGVNPNIAGRSKGDFVHAANVGELIVEHCDMVDTRFGVYVDGYNGSRAGGATIQIRYNRGLNMDGRRSNGHGGWQVPQSDRDWSHFAQLNHVHGVPNMEIAWNQVIDQPFQSSVDDVINVYQSSGTADSPIRIHDNFIDGAYPNNPKTDTFSGGGIITDGGTDTASDADAYVIMQDNQVVSTTNYGLAVSNGNHVTMINNRVVSCGTLPDGSPIAAQNVGIYISDIYGGNVANGTMHDDHAEGNVTGWVNKSPRLASSGYRNDYYFSIPGTSGDYARNKPWPHAPTLADERGEMTVWRAKLARAHVTLGPSWGQKAQP